MMAAKRLPISGSPDPNALVRRAFTGFGTTFAN